MFTSEFKQDDNIITDPQKIAESFNDYFVNIGKKINEQVPIVDKQPEEYITANL